MSNLLKGLISDADVGHPKDRRKVTLMDFAEAKDAVFAPEDVFVLMSAPTPRGNVGEVHPIAIEEQQLWTATARHLVEELESCRRVELALGHSHPMLKNPDAVIDAGRASRSEA